MYRGPGRGESAGDRAIGRCRPRGRRRIHSTCAGA